MYKNIEKVCDIRCSLGEGPCWDSGNNRIYWIDLIEKAIHFFNLKNNKIQTIKLNKFVGSIGLRKSGGLIAALDDGFYFINEGINKEVLVKKVKDNLGGKRFNDGKVDAMGNFWTGSISYGENLPTGILYCLESNLKLKENLNNITISNGITWSLDNKKMYFIDTPTLRVDVFDFDIYKNDIKNRKTAFEISKEIGYPDGMTIDVEGKLWIAHWGGNKVCRWDPVTKKIITIVDIPAVRVSSCIFGGVDLNDLFVTTAKRGFAENMNVQDDKDGGYIYRIQTNTKGIDSFKFNN
ncbi:MAG: SMP-30/gluconolactonase/LRE family protein [Candidatus Humimicrobiaceae bacterium]